MWTRGKEKATIALIGALIVGAGVGAFLLSRSQGGLKNHLVFGFWLIVGCGLFLMVIVGTILILTGSRPVPQGTCAACGYNLEGNESGVCPECGTHVTESTSPGTDER